MTEPMMLTVLILPREGVFFAQSIEHAFSATGRNKDEAFENLCQLLQGQAALDREAGRKPLIWMRPARGAYRDLATRVQACLPNRTLDLFPTEADENRPEQHLRLAPVG